MSPIIKRTLIFLAALILLELVLGFILASQTGDTYTIAPYKFITIPFFTVAYYAVQVFRTRSEREDEIEQQAEKNS